MIDPYYSHGGVVVYHGDARVLLPQLVLDPARCVVVTDPIWPNAPAGSFGCDDPSGLFLEVAKEFPRLARRAVVQLGCTSDPRFLVGMPAAMPFVRVCWLRYACPSYLGTVLGSGDVAYVFGSHEGPSGKTVLPGETTSTSSRGKEADHPMPRKLEHLAWLIGNFTSPDDVVLDPFCGSGTTLLAAKNAGRASIGIELDDGYCNVAVGRLAQERLAI